MTHSEEAPDDGPAAGHGHHGHTHHGHGHQGHEHDRGLSGMLRYLRFAPRMWRSELNDAVLGMVAPNPGETMIDVGAGMGPATVRAAKGGVKVIAVEPTPFLRRVLTLRRLFQRHRARIDVVDGAAEAIPAPDGEVDAVMAVNTMHHWVDPAAAATEIARVLGPSGRVVLVDEDFEDPSHPEYERFGSHRDGGDASDTDRADDGHHGFSMVDAGHMGDLLRAAGLSDVVAAKQAVSGRPAIVVTASGAS